jgi:hypothetical protein
VRLGSKVYYCIKGFFGKQLIQEGAVLDCAMDESMSGCRIWSKILKIGKIASVGQSIQVDNAPGWLLCKDVADKVRTNKTGTAGHKEVFFLHTPALVESFTSSSLSQPPLKTNGLIEKSWNLKLSFKQVMCQPVLKEAGQH